RIESNLENVAREVSIYAERLSVRLGYTD
ncbi:MAG: hypothetical protein JWN30_1492, partial [Bacilli bacterium]|nr:hypothetical protein [Bacilli bacterium]